MVSVRQKTSSSVRRAPRIGVLLMIFGLGLATAGEVPRCAAEDAAPAASRASRPTVDVPDPTAEAIRFHRGGIAIWCVSQGLYLAIPLVVLWAGWSPRLRDFCRKKAGGRRWFTVWMYFVVYWTAMRLVRLPLAWYAGFARLHAYGLSNQTIGKWATDWGIQLGIDLVAGLVVVTVLYALLAARPRRWWLDLSLLSVPAAAFLLLIVPIWIDPLFNDFGPMQDKGLERKILALADRAGIAGGRVFEVQKSVDTPAINAYVTGMMGTKRIVLWDTIIERLDERQLLFVVAHEMGHYVLHHAFIGTFLSCSLVFVAAWGIDRVTRLAVPRFKRRWGVAALDDIASLPLLVLLAQLAWLGCSPLANATSRYMEREADRFGLELTQDSRAAATAFVEMQHTNLAHPSPGWFDRMFRGTHPTLAERIHFCNRYAPWESGRDLRYGRFFHAAP